MIQLEKGVTSMSLKAIYSEEIGQEILFKMNSMRTKKRVIILITRFMCYLIVSGSRVYCKHNSN